MPDRIKKALVESFIGAIAIAWLFAEGITHLVTGLTTPLGMWMTERLRQQSNPGYSGILTPRLEFPIALAVPQLIAGALLLLIAWLLFRWLYLDVPAASETGPEPLQGA